MLLAVHIFELATVICFHFIVLSLVADYTWFGTFLLTRSIGKATDEWHGGQTNTSFSGYEELPELVSLCVVFPVALAVYTHVSVTCD